jgi:Skp family chaperone for outer membrane proteins
MYKNIFCKAVILAIAVAATPVLAQTDQIGLGGPVIPGVCLMSREAVLVNSAAGKAATARLQQLTNEAQTEIDTERAPVTAEVETLRKAQATLTPEQRKTREQAVGVKLQALQAKAEHRGREIEVTRTKVLDQISVQAQTVIASVYKQKSCGLLMDRNSVLGGNLTNDITAAVVQGLDAKLSTITFNRETLPIPAAK